MKGRTAASVSLTIVVNLTCLACDYYPLKSDRDFRYFQIKVDSVSVVSPLRVVRPGYGEVTWWLPSKSPLTVTDTLRVQFHGWIGPNGCHQFSHFDVTKIDMAGYKVSVWGKEQSGVGCFQLLIVLRHVLEIYPPLRKGTWILLVSQPDGSVLRKEVVAR